MKTYSVGVGGVTSDVAEMIRRPAWMRDALCREYSHLNWIPERGDGTFDTLRSICRSCLVTDRCLAYALDNPDVIGVWGGTTAKERKRLRSGRPRPVPRDDRRPRGYAGDRGRS
jgi:WhiB family redox-sensing transcriptional regulator